MKTIAILTCAAALGLSCGDNQKSAPADASHDAVDAPSFPAAPTLGAQIDRMGRPAINTALVGTFADAAPAAAAKHDKYNQASDPATWKTTEVATGRTILAEFMVNLAIIDVLDQGDSNIAAPTGCGNQVLYNGNPAGGGTPAADSYSSIATVLADDMLYVDTTQASCNSYLALEVAYVTAGGHSECGGRTPVRDVIDASYSMLAAGLKGFTMAGSEFFPKYIDGAGMHADTSMTFPYFGPPH